MMRNLTSRAVETSYSDARKEEMLCRHVVANLEIVC